MKQIISTILLVALCLPAWAQDVVKLLEPAYADSGAVYRQSVYVPQKWSKRRIVLSIERPLGTTSVRVNGAEVGGDSSVAVPHVLDVTRHIVAGGRNLIEIRVSGSDSRGMLGTLELQSQPRRLYINKVKVHPRPYSGEVGIEMFFSGDSPDYGYYGVQLMVQHEDRDSANIYVAQDDIWDDHMSMVMKIHEQDLLWDEFHPDCYRLAIGAGDDYKELTFGMREAGVVDGRLFLNRRPIYLRGAVIDDSFAEWGHRMPVDIDTWEQVFRRLERMGLNHVKFSGYCPTDAAFAAADKVGLYLQPEAKSKFEMGRIADVYGHHPSLVLMSLGDSTYVWNDGYLVPVKLNQSVICGADIQQYKTGVEQTLLSDSSGCFLFGGLLDKSLDQKEFNQFCRPIIPLARLQQSVYYRSDTLRAQVEVYNAMYGHLQNIRTSYYLHTDSGQVVAGGLLHSGEIPLAPNNKIGEIVFPLDSVPADCKKLILTLTVGNSSIRNSWEVEIKKQCKKSEQN